MRKLLLSLLFVCVAFLFNSTTINAASPTPAGFSNPRDPHGSCGANGVSTAIGCVPIGDQVTFVAWMIGWAIGIAGGIAMLLIVIAGFNIMTAAGDPQKLNGGRELLTAAVSGLILIVFSVFLLNLIGYDILHLPGF